MKNRRVKFIWKCKYYIWIVKNIIFKKYVSLCFRDLLFECLCGFGNVLNNLELGKRK